MAKNKQPYTKELSHNNDPFIANTPVPVPTALTVEANSSTPTPTNATPAATLPFSTNFNENSSQEDTTKSLFVEDLSVSLQQWTFGLNWRQPTHQKLKTLDKLLGKNQPMDLDLSCLLFDTQGQILERVWFKNVRDTAESIRHRGDSLVGTLMGEKLTFDSRFDLEKIDIFLEKIPESVHFIAFVLSSFYGQPLATAVDGYCHISDDEGNVITQIGFSKLPQKCPALWVATLSRELETWQYTANQLSLDKPALAEFEQQIGQVLQKMQKAKHGIVA